MSKKTEWGKKTTNVLFTCSFLPMTQQREDFITQYLSLLNSQTFISSPEHLTLSQTTKFTLFQAQRVRRRQFPRLM